MWIFLRLRWTRASARSSVRSAPRVLIRSYIGAVRTVAVISFLDRVVPLNIWRAARHHPGGCSNLLVVQRVHRDIRSGG